MEFTAEQIANLVKGKVLGDPQTKVSGFSPIEEATKGHLCFLANPAFVPLLSGTEASVVIVSESLIEHGKNYVPTLIEVDDGYLAFQILMNIYNEMKIRKSGVEQPSFVHESVKVAEDVYIGMFAYVSDKSVIGSKTNIYPNCFIGKNVKIGKNCTLYSGVRVYDDCVIGDNCIIQSNTVIGSDGFGFQPTKDGFKKIPQLGNVILEDDVEIGANCAIDRGTIGATVIGKGTKLDNLIQIAHNVKVGHHNAFAAQVGIAGSTTIGDWNMLGGQTGVVGHIKIGNGVKTQAQSGINSNVEDEQILYGSPAIPASDFRRSYVYFRNFPQIVERITSLEKSNKQDCANE